MNAKKITKKAFLAAAKKGWETVDYVDGYFFLDKNEEALEARDMSRAISACAIGAYCLATGQPPSKVCAALDDVRGWLAEAVADASNKAGSKAAALAAISKLDWDA